MARASRVAISFTGSVVVTVQADPNDAEAWSRALARAWADVDPNDLSEAAHADGHEILGSERE